MTIEQKQYVYKYLVAQGWDAISAASHAKIRAEDLMKYDENDWSL